MNSCEKTTGFFAVLQKFLVRKKFKNRLEDVDKAREIKKANFLTQEDYDILDEIEKVKEKLDQAKIEFNMQTNADLISSAIYQIEALEAKFNYLIKQARLKNLKYDEKILSSI